MALFFYARLYLF